MRKVSILLITLLAVLVACAPPTLEMPAQAETTAMVDGEAAVDETTVPGIATETEIAVEKVPGTSNEANVAVSSTVSLADSVLLSVFDERHQVRPVDPATGQDLAGYAPVDLGVDSLWSVFAPDGRMLAAIGAASQLILIDLETWQDTITELRFPNVVGMAFSPDGAHLALTFYGRKGPSLALVDVAKQEIKAQVELDFEPRWQQLHFTADGRSLVVYGTGLPDVSGDQEIPGPARVAVRNAVDLGLEWEVNLVEVLDGFWCEKNCSQSHQGRTLWQPAVVMGQDGRSLFIVHAHEEKLTVVDLAGRTARSMPVEPAVSWLDQLMALTAGVVHAKVVDGTSKQAVISPDGSRLYVAGWHTEITETDPVAGYNETSLGLQVIDSISGREIDTVESEARQVALSADGSQLYLSGWQGEMPWTEVLDAKSLEVIVHLDGYRLMPARRLDGRPALLGIGESQYQSELALIDAKSFEIVYSWALNDYAAWVTAP